MSLRARLSLPLCLAFLTAGIVPVATPAATPPPLPPPLVERFDGNPQNAGLWEEAPLGTGPTAGIVGGSLVVTLPPNSSGLQFQHGLSSKFALRGDFDIQVDYQLLEWPATSGARAGFAFFDGAVWQNLHRASLGVNEQEGQPRESYTMDVPGEAFFRTETDDTQGTLRLVREAETITGYYAPLGTANWTALGTATFTDDLRPSILAWGHDGSFAGQRVRVAFDNFQVTSGKVVTAVNLASFTLSKAQVKGGQQIYGRVTLDAPAPAGGLLINLRNENPAAKGPAKVTVPAGKNTARFKIRTRLPKKTKRGVITAASRGWVYSQELVVTRRKR